MAPRTRGGITALFGSQARARILGYLAQSSVPQTGYAIAKDLQLGVSNVYPELKRLEEWTLLASRPGVRGGKRYTLIDDDLRRFLLKRIRILSSSDWFSGQRIAERRARFEEARKIPFKAPRSAGGRRPLRGEFARPAEKDRALKRVRGLAAKKARR